jgi:Zn-dependent membrane protease YugP
MHAWRAHHRPHRRSPRATLAAALTYVGQSLMALLNNSSVIAVPSAKPPIST